MDFFSIILNKTEPVYSVGKWLLSSGPKYLFASFFATTVMVTAIFFFKKGQVSF